MGRPPSPSALAYATVHVFTAAHRRFNLTVTIWTLRNVDRLSTVEF